MKSKENKKGNKEHRISWNLKNIFKKGLIKPKTGSLKKLRGKKTLIRLSKEENTINNF